MLLQKSTEFSIDLNIKDEAGCTAFHHVCSNGLVEIAEVLLQNSAQYNIDLKVSWAVELPVKKIIKIQIYKVTKTGFNVTIVFFQLMKFL